MSRASRKCYTLALLLWAAPPRGRSRYITRPVYVVVCILCMSPGRTQGPQGWGAPKTKVPLFPSLWP